MTDTAAIDAALVRLWRKRGTRLDLATSDSPPETIRASLAASCHAVAAACDRMIDELLAARTTA